MAFTALFLVCLSSLLSWHPGVGVYLALPTIAIEAVAISPGAPHFEPVQWRVLLAGLGSHTVCDVNIPQNHVQRGVAQVLLQQEYVSAVQQKLGCIGMPHEMGMQPSITTTVHGGMFRAALRASRRLA